MKYVIGNWKSNQNLTESLIWIDGIQAIKPKFSVDTTVILCLPFTDIAGFNHKLADLELPILTGAQNVSHLEPGKHTGEITANMLCELVSYCIVGHSERRREFAETSEMVAEKARQLLENSITPIVCLDLPYLDEQIKELFQKILMFLVVSLSTNRLRLSVPVSPWTRLRPIKPPTKSVFLLIIKHLFSMVVPSLPTMSNLLFRNLVSTGSLLEQTVSSHSFRRHH